MSLRHNVELIKLSTVSNSVGSSGVVKFVEHAVKSLLRSARAAEPFQTRIWHRAAKDHRDKRAKPFGFFSFAFVVCRFTSGHE